MQNSRYVIITPVRNEAEYIEKTIRSVLSQTVTPVLWIIINDGSTDETGNIIDRYAATYPWIRSVHRKDRGVREAGGGVIKTFYDGYNTGLPEEYDFLVKLDGDLSFEPDYFQVCFERFDADPKLGVGGGLIYNVVGDKQILEKAPAFHVRGATKIYRRQCWEAIGGLIMAPGWDTMDEVIANMLGWNSRSFEGTKVVHHRYTGMADGNWKNYIKNGKANYISGYHPLFMIFKCVKRLFQKPYFIGSIALLYGFLAGYITGIPQIENRKAIKYLRKQQINRLLFKESLWK